MLTDLKVLMDDVDIAPEHFSVVSGYLSILKSKHEATYDHVLRVGKLAAAMAEVARIPGVTAKMMMWAGLLHDVGKSLIAIELLNKTVKFDANDHAAMEPHVMHGWELIQETYEHTAAVIVRHHRYGKKPYPTFLPPLPYYLEPREEAIEAAARLLALADYWDALMTRQNDRNEGLIDKRNLFFRENIGCEDLIIKLEQAGILTF